MDKKYCQDVKVLEICPVGQTKMPGIFFEMKLTAPDWKNYHPGQFVMLRPCSWGLDFTWGRPFSICRAQDEWFSLFIQVVGKGTAKLATLQPGDKLTVWGPLGQGFAVEPESPTLCLAGGMGIAPFIGYCLKHPAPQQIEVFFAHKAALDCYPVKHLQDKLRFSAMQEKNAEDLPAIIAGVEDKVQEYQHGLVLCCGPTPFMRTVQNKLLAIQGRGQVSLENSMACGVGACLGCVCDNGQGKRVQTCTQGPVFWADDVVF